jgi:predicted ATPase
MSYIPTVVYGHMHKAIFELMRRNPSGAAPHVQVFVELARQHVMPNWLAYGRVFEPWARWHMASRDGSLSDMRRAIVALREQGVALYTIALETVLAEVEAEEGQLETANATVGRALTETERTGHRWFEAETHRIRGEILLKRDLANTAPAEEAFLTAIAIAQRQKAKSFELRAALPLAKLYQSSGRALDAHAVLAAALGRYDGNALQTLVAIMNDDREFALACPPPTAGGRRGPGVCLGYTAPWRRTGFLHHATSD